MSDQHRELGVDLGALGEKIADHDYPATQDELLAEYGDEEIELEGETVTFESLLEPLNEDEYAAASEVNEAILSMVGDEAIGRKNYSDRTPPAPGEDRQDEGAPDQDGQREQESF
ncbi:DUF5789 family protein [Halovivax gelatinilyticus]|uniref:DUF5789 family protein n=1 Tax=Halovivax gelatinilyticus TaxID=2961597 RepID=UPI0020CA4566|nr:hypothetical protein [Halovivax gelatinilyticus]